MLATECIISHTGNSSQTARISIGFEITTVRGETFAPFSGLIRTSGSQPLFRTQGLKQIASIVVENNPQ